MEKSKNIKPSILCPICNKRFIKKYISQHIRRLHKNNEYCKIVKRGMTYKKFLFGQVIKGDNKTFFCEACNKSIKAKSKYHHLNTLLHKIFTNGKNSNKCDKDMKEIISVKNDDFSSKKDLKYNELINTEIKYTQISCGFIPKNFLTNKIEDLSEHLKSENMFITEINDKNPIENTFSSNKSYSSSDLIEQSHNLRESYSIFDIDTLRIRKDVDHIIKKMIKKKY